MFYCPPNITLTQLWVGHGLSHCFMDTVATSIMFGFIIICGGIQHFVYKKYSTLLDKRLLPISFLFNLQVILSVLLILLAIVRLILQATILNNKVIYGYMVLSVSLTVITWPISLHVLFMERRRALPSIPTWGHGLVLLIFWTLVFINENLAFLNLKNEAWWFDMSSISDYIELIFFIIRYISAMLLFVIGLKAPGIPSAKDYFIYRHHLQQEQNEPLLTEESPQSQPSTFSNFWRKCKMLAPFIWPRKNLFLQMRVLFCFVLLFLGRVVNIFVPIYSKKIVDSLSWTSSTSSLTFRWDYIVIFVALWFLQGQGNNSCLNNLRSFLWIRIQQYTVRETQMELYAHLHSLSLRWHLSRKIGEVLRVMDRGTSSVTNLLSYIVFNICPTFADITIAVVYFALAFNVWCGLIVLVTMAFYLASTIIITEWRTKFRRNMNKLDNAVEAKGVDALLNFETVKYYNAEDYELQKYKKCIDAFQEAEWMSSASLNLLNVIQNVIITLGIMSGTLLVAHIIVAGQGLTVGDYVLFSTYILQLYTPLNYFGTYYRMIQTSFIDMENMFDLLKEEPEVVDDVNATTLRVTKGQIEFNDVCFSYVPERQILKNISFTVPPGETVALVGPTGSGKSTIIRLLFRFYDIHSGEICIDSQNIAKVKQKSLRKHIGVVPQDTVLFNNDIRYNIQYGRVSATDDEVEESAQAADVHDQILRFPDGYNTIVGERGLKLSGGEKQRVAIARTILKAPSIVLLDEATSSLDTQTERNIQASLNKICDNRTTIIVAHRLSTVIHANMILVIRDGEIVERGRHDDLLEKNGVYAAMWKQQLQSKDHNTDEEEGPGGSGEHK